MDSEHLTAHYYDTLDHDLERLGLVIARVPSEAGVIWRLTLPRGEIVEAWEPGTAGLAPPEQIMELIGSILDGKPLVPESAVLREPGARRLREALGAQLEALLAHEPGVRLGTEPENLHQHRVAARRTRAFLRATRAYVDPSWARASPSCWPSSEKTPGRCATSTCSSSMRGPHSLRPHLRTARARTGYSSS